MRVSKALWIWLNHTNTHVLQGLLGGGGQPGVFFGRSGDEVEAFFEGTGVTKEERRWDFTIEPYSGLPEWPITIVERSEEKKRPRECYITASQARSRNAYPLWVRVVTPIRSWAQPQQAIALLRNGDDRFHVRVWGQDHLDRLPAEVRAIVEDWQILRQKNHLISLGFEFDDWEATTLAESATDEDWHALAERTRLVRERKPRKRETSHERYLRDVPMRNLFLKCMGYECQVVPCPFTDDTPTRLQELVAEVHHIREWFETLDDSPFNLSVVCANHHRIFTHLSRLKNITVEREGDRVEIEFPLETFVIERDLSRLRQELQ